MSIGQTSWRLSFDGEGCKWFASLTKFGTETAGHPATKLEPRLKTKEEPYRLVGMDDVVDGVEPADTIDSFHGHEGSRTFFNTHTDPFLAVDIKDPFAWLSEHCALLLFAILSIRFRTGNPCNSTCWWLWRSCWLRWPSCFGNSK